MSNSENVTVEINQNDQQMILSSNDYLSMANDFVIDSPEMYQASAQELRLIKDAYKNLDISRLEIARPLKEAATRLQAFFKPALDHLAQAKKIHESNMIDWDSKQEKIRLIAQAKAEKEAREKAEKIAAEARAMAEKERKAREKAEAKSLAERKKLEAAAKKEKDKTKAAEMALKAKEDADHAEQQRIESERIAQEAQDKALEEAEQASQVVVINTAAKASGTTISKTVEVKVTNKMALIKAVANGDADISILTVDISWLNTLAKKANKNGDVLNYPGIEVIEKKSVTTRKVG